MRRARFCSLASVASALALRPRVARATGGVVPPWESAPRSDPGATAWFAHHDRLHRDIVVRNPRAIFFGDSIFERFGSTGLAVWRATFEPREALRVASGGDTTQRALWHVDSGIFDDASPRAIVVSIGTNDLPDFSATDTARGILAVVDRLRMRLPSARILLLGVLPRFDDPDLARAVVRTNASLAAAAFDANVRYRDVGARVAGADPSSSGAFDDDGLHLRPLGYERLAAAIVPDLDEMLR